jgi:hypothetical protein
MLGFEGKADVLIYLFRGTALHSALHYRYCLANIIQTSPFA